MNTDQERSVDALSLFYGGWTKVTTIYSWATLCTTAGNQPNWLVYPDGSVESDHEKPIKMTAEQLHAAVYDRDDMPGRDPGE
jgi:hypothetical protein